MYMRLYGGVGFFSYVPYVTSKLLGLAMGVSRKVSFLSCTTASLIIALSLDNSLELARNLTITIRRLKDCATLPLKRVD